MKKVIVGISGGVDSSVAAWLLKQEGYLVEGLFMINWKDTTGTLHGDCPWHDDLIFAQLVSKKLGIPLHTVDFSDEYRKRIVEYMFAEYQKGRTPNPDVLCNREVKFDLFIKEALKLGADFIATGHYCQKETLQINGKDIYRLLAGTDPEKEQSYFLCQLNQDQLKQALFPVGNMLKSEVREIARKHELPTADRKDSQGICFVGKVDLPTFLQQKLSKKEGDIIEIGRNASILPLKKPVMGSDYSYEELVRYAATNHYDASMGTIIGKHPGAHYYTIGQRKGINVGGKKEPLFVIANDTKNNILYVGEGHGHPGLNRYGLFISAKDIHWICKDVEMLPGEKRVYHVRIRYRQPLQEATVYRLEQGMFILFKKTQRGITSGQFAAWYNGNELMGSGTIDG